MDGVVTVFGPDAGIGAELRTGAGGGTGAADGIGLGLGTGAAIGADGEGGGSSCMGVSAKLSLALLLFGSSLELSVGAFRLPNATRKLCTKVLR